MLECSPSRRTADCGRALPQSALVSISAGQLSWLTAEVLMAHRAIGSGLLRNVVNPAQTPRYYRTVSSPVSRKWRHQVSGRRLQVFPGRGEPEGDKYTIRWSVSPKGAFPDRKKLARTIVIAGGQYPRPGTWSRRRS